MFLFVFLFSASQLVVISIPHCIKNPVENSAWTWKTATSTVNPLSPPFPKRSSILRHFWNYQLEVLFGSRNQIKSVQLFWRQNLKRNTCFFLAAVINAYKQIFLSLYFKLFPAWTMFFIVLWHTNMFMINIYKIITTTKTILFENDASGKIFPRQINISP